MRHEPVCSKCEIELRPYKNGVIVVDYADYGPISLTHADEWHCAGCGFRVIVGFAEGPFSRGTDDDFMNLMGASERAGLARHNRPLTPVQRN